MNSLDEVKSKRPPCTHNNKKHTWVSYKAAQVDRPTGYQKCIDCGYEEDIVYAVDV